MPVNPRGDQRGDDLADREMFGAEACQWGGVEERAEQNQLVGSSCRLPIAAKIDGEQSDGKDHSKNRIGPDHLAGDGEGQECERVQERAAHVPRILLLSRVESGKFGETVVGCLDRSGAAIPGVRCASFRFGIDGCREKSRSFASLRMTNLF